MDGSALLELMRSADDGELVRRLLGTIVQAVVVAEATAHRRRPHPWTRLVRSVSSAPR